MASDLNMGNMEGLMEEISALAQSYTPEWRFNLPNPDMGTALACLFARVIQDTAMDYSQVPKELYRDFMEAAGCRTKEASCARGFMTFGLVKPDMPELVLPKGWGVVSLGEEGSVAMETEDAVYVSAASVRLRPGRWAGRTEHLWLMEFDRPVVKGVISLLFVMTGQERGSVPGLIWEYYGKSGWTHLAVKDGTDNLGHTGIVGFAATSDFCCLDKGEAPRWAVRVRCKAGLPEHLPSLYINAAPVRAAEPGAKGNLKPGAKNRLKKTAGYVSVIKNPGYFFGGGDEEPWEDAAARTAARLRHQFRAVTPGDYERLVRECCRGVEKVKCFPGYDSAGNKKWGAVTVVVLLKDFLEGRPYFFRIREELEHFFQDKAGASLTAGRALAFVSPRFIRMDVRAVLCVRDHGLVMEVREAAVNTLTRFLDPITGGSDAEGWGMGILPDHMQLKNCLQRVPGVFFVRQLTCLCLEEQESGWKETEWASASLLPWCLPVPGTCMADVEVE